MGLFCKHDWETKVKETLPSPFEQVTAAGMATPDALGEKPARLALLSFVKKLVVILACKKCGKLYRSVTGSVGHLSDS